MAYECIKVEEKYDGQVTEIIIGPAPANILTAKVMAEISAQLEEDQTKPQKKLVIFSGEGKHFGFGASVEEHTADQVTTMLPQFHAFIGELLHCPILTLAKVKGMCLGGAFELVLACNFVVADESAKFAVPEIQLAVFPPVASILLPFRCGDVIASEIILGGEQFNAERLFKLALINDVCERGKVDEKVTEFFEKLFQPKSASSLKIANRAARMSICKQYNSLIPQIENLYLKELMATKDANEGITAFLEKRAPKWQDA